MQPTFSQLAGACLFTPRDQEEFQKYCVTQVTRRKQASYYTVTSDREKCEPFVTYLKNKYCVESPRNQTFYWEVAQRNLDFTEPHANEIFGNCGPAKRDITRTETPYSLSGNSLQTLTCPGGKRVEISKLAFRAVSAAARTIFAEAGVCVDIENGKPTSLQFDAVARVLMNRANFCASPGADHDQDRVDFCKDKTDFDKKAMLPPYKAQVNGKPTELPGYVPWLEHVVARYGAFDPWRDPNYGRAGKKKRYIGNSPIALFNAVCPPTSMNISLHRTKDQPVDIWAAILQTEEEEEETDEQEMNSKPDIQTQKNDLKWDYAVQTAMEMVFCSDDFKKRTEPFKDITFFSHNSSIPAHLIRERRESVSVTSIGGVPLVPPNNKKMCEIGVFRKEKRSKGCNFQQLSESDQIKFIDFIRRSCGANSKDLGLTPRAAALLKRPTTTSKKKLNSKTSAPARKSPAKKRK